MEIDFVKIEIKKKGWQRGGGIIINGGYERAEDAIRIKIQNSFGRAFVLLIG